MHSGDLYRLIPDFTQISGEVCGRRPERNHFLERHAGSVDTLSLSRQDTVSTLPFIHGIEDNLSMKKKPRTPPLPICLRTRQAREALGWGRKQMADRLGIKRDAYAKYEIRSPLPTMLLATFCILTGFEPWYILTGRPVFDRDATDPEMDLFDPKDKDSRQAAFDADARRSLRALKAEDLKK